MDLFSSHITKMEEINAAVRPKKSVTDVVQEHTIAIHESVDKLKENAKDLNKKLKSIERMVQRILKASSVNELDDDDNDD